MVEALRTPDVRFENLPNFPYEPNYTESLKGYENLRMHYIDVGPKNSEEVAFCPHGQPTWSYLYRKMIPIFLAKGFRIVTPDFFGFGRSDKPIKKEIYTFDFHRGSLIEIIKHLDLKNITLCCQDWGGILGLTLPMEMPIRFKRLILMNTTLPTGEFEPSRGFIAFRDWVNKTPDMDVGRLLMRATPNLTPEEAKAYNAPFPDAHYKVGVRMFPNLVPISKHMPGANIAQKARDWFKKQWHGESFMAIGMMDPVLGPPVMKILRKMIPGCPKPLRIKEAGHFLQEWGDIVLEKAFEYFKL